MLIMQTHVRVSVKQLNFISCCHDNLQIKDSTNQTIASHPHTPLALIVPKLLLIYCKLTISEILGLRLHSTMPCGDLCKRWDTMSLISDEENIPYWISKLNKPVWLWHWHYERMFHTCLYLTHVWCLVEYSVYQVFNTSAMEWSPACGREWCRINSLSLYSISRRRGVRQFGGKWARSDPPWVWATSEGKFTCMPLRKICSTEELMKLETK